ncbi:hypothetical protein HK102_009488, partial [Quaeritorhiza haematococci]
MFKQGIFSSRTTTMASSLSCLRTVRGAFSTSRTHPFATASVAQKVLAGSGSKIG